MISFLSATFDIEMIHLSSPEIINPNNTFFHSYVKRDLSGVNMSRLSFLQNRIKTEAVVSGDATLMTQITSPATDKWFGTSLSISKQWAFIGDPASCESRLPFYFCWFLIVCRFPGVWHLFFVVIIIHIMTMLLTSKIWFWFDDLFPSLSHRQQLWSGLYLQTPALHSNLDLHPVFGERLLRPSPVWLQCVGWWHGMGFHRRAWI